MNCLNGSDTGGMEGSVKYKRNKFDKEIFTAEMDYWKCTAEKYIQWRNDGRGAAYDGSKQNASERYF